MAVTIPSAGELRQRGTLEVFSDAPTARGGHVETPQVVARRIHSRVRLSPGSPIERGDQTAPRRNYEVVIRRRAGVTTSLQFRYHAKGGDRVLEILSVVDLDTQQRFLLLQCREAA